MKLSESILRFLTVRVDEEMRHGQKIARRVKARPARGVPASPEASFAAAGRGSGPGRSAPAPESPAAPEAAAPEAAAPEAAAPEAPAQPES